MDTSKLRALCLSTKSVDGTFPNANDQAIGLLSSFAPYRAASSRKAYCQANAGTVR